MTRRSRAPALTVSTLRVSASLLLLAAVGCERLPSSGLPAPAQAERTIATPQTTTPSAAAAFGQPPTAGRRDTPDPYVTAWQRGVSFRASGIEPGWYVEVAGGDRPTRLELVWDYASNRLESRQVHRSDTGALLTFEADDPRFAVRVRAERTPCAEPGSGLTSDYTVTVEVGAQILRGCGRGR